MNNSFNGLEGSTTSYLDKVADFESKLKFDPATYYHSLSVASLSVQLLKKSQCDLDEILIYYAGLFHDIGKTITPLTVLKKANPLSQDELNQVRDHTKQGFRILQKHRFPLDVLFAALLHHEKYDGSGYPVGFAGKEIPIAARLVSICDSFDALTSARPHRMAYPVQQAIRIMEGMKEQFDPQLLDIFLVNIADKKIKTVLSKPENIL